MLKGKITGLRAIEMEDLPYLLKWRNKPEYRRYFREYRELSMSHQSNWYESQILKDQKTVMFSIIELSSQRLLGSCGLCYIDWVNCNAEFSLFIGANSLYIDNIFAPEAALIMISYAFQELGMHRIWSEIYEFDKQKKLLFEILGFSLDGQHRQTHWTEGKWHDSLFYGLLEDEFSSKNRKITINE